jgi:hypothetical protein
MNANAITTSTSIDFKNIAQQNPYQREPSLNNVHSIRDASTSKKRWLCSVAEHVKLSNTVENGINVSGKGKYSQYELIVKLLKAETCDVIYFDCRFSTAQIAILKMLQLFSNTELVHARLAMQFNQAAS